MTAQQFNELKRVDKHLSKLDKLTLYIYISENYYLKFQLFPVDWVFLL